MPGKALKLTDSQAVLRDYIQNRIDASGSCLCDSQTIREAFPDVNLLATLVMFMNWDIVYDNVLDLTFFKMSNETGI